VTTASETDLADIAGAAIEYRVIAAPDVTLPTLIFLHEGLGCAALWKDFPDQLCGMTGCHGLVYSRAGYGKSDRCTLPRPLDYMQQEARLTLPQVLAHFEIDNFILIGHSDGASISLVHAGMDREPAPRAVIAMAPHVFCEEVSVQGIRLAKQAYEEGDLKVRLEKFHGMNTETAFRGWNDAWLDPDFRRWNIESFLPAISIPVLVIQGFDDNYGTIAQVDAIEKSVQGMFRKCLLDACGHNPWAEKTDVVLDVSAQFIGQVTDE
jgi:pimeloyl-ACP methyl ester carboxylesterase